MSVPRSSNAGASGISPTEPNLVKPCAAVLSALPVVAFSISRRNYSIVCLSPRLTATRVIHRTRRRSTPDASFIRLALHELAEVFSSTDAQTFVVEPSVRSGFRRQLAEWATSRDVRLVWSRRADACSEVCGRPFVKPAVTRLCERYEVLRRRLVNQNGTLVRNVERWRHLRPLVDAFVLAHAFAARSVIAAFGGEIPQHPKPNYASRTP